MSKFARIRHFLAGAFTIGLGILMIAYPEDGYPIVVSIIALSLVLKGLHLLVFYARQARHMVGGTSILYRGAIMLDLGVLVGSFTTIPIRYVVYYLLYMTIFYGIIDILRSREARKIASPVWKSQLLQGILWLVLALLVRIYRNSTDVVVTIYSIGMILRGLMRIANAFKKTDVIYIQ